MLVHDAVDAERPTPPRRGATTAACGASHCRGCGRSRARAAAGGIRRHSGCLRAWLLRPAADGQARGDRSWLPCSCRSRSSGRERRTGIALPRPSRAAELVEGLRAPTYRQSCESCGVPVIHKTGDASRPRPPQMQTAEVTRRRALLRVQLDHQLLLRRDRNVRTRRALEHPAAERVPIDRDPRRAARRARPDPSPSSTDTCSRDFMRTRTSWPGCTMEARDVDATSDSPRRGDAG